MKFQYSNALEFALKSSIKGEVRFDSTARRVYSVDASIYEIEPIGIVLPKDKEDLFTIVNIAKKYSIPLIPRGAATGISGGCIGNGLIVDTSKYFREILEINFEKEFVICQPGVVQDSLNVLLATQGYRLGPDTSTGNRATLGGMLANNAAGSRSLRYGKMVDHILSVQVLLTTGELIHFAEIDESTWQRKHLLKNTEGKIYSDLAKIKSTYEKDIEKAFPHIPRRVSGYNLDALSQMGVNGEGFNISKLIAGSEGTLGIITEMTLRIVKKPNFTGLVLLLCPDMIKGMELITDILKYLPLSVEMMDHYILDAGRNSPQFKNKLDWLFPSHFLDSDFEAVIAIECEGNSELEVANQMALIANSLPLDKFKISSLSIQDQERINQIWDMRKAGLGLLLSKRRYSRAIAFIEDVTVAPQNLAKFIFEFKNILKKYNKTAGIYGHVGSGCMHVRPYIDLRQPEELSVMQAIMEETAALLLSFGGALSGEHGDGIVRTWLNRHMFGERIYQAFVELKRAFDPENLMNPGKIVHPQQGLLENLRISPEIHPKEIDTFLDFSPEGGFALAVDLCNGNAQCRKNDSLMCPSFQASGDEYHTTRARAQALRAVVNGRSKITDLTDPGVYDVLDLCLECKGCKTECPSQVDMAKMKAEFLYHYGNKHGFSLRSRLFAHIGKLNEIRSIFPRLSNVLGSFWISKQILHFIGIAPERNLPELAVERFTVWVNKIKKNNEVQKEAKVNQVVLFSDTFTEYHQPHIGLAAFKVLNALGFEVIVPSWKCCGRPAFSKGFLEQAREQAMALIDHLYSYAKEGLKIIGLEPSCVFTIKDDFESLIMRGNDQNRDLLDKIKTVKEACQTFDEFIEELIVADKFHPKFNENAKTNLESLKCEDRKQKIKVHTHCYQKALIGSKSTINVLKKIPDVDVVEIPTGCCGLAGSFGYEKEHYALSMKIAELHLYPALRNMELDTKVVANGFSCRNQIEHGLGGKCKPQHLAEVLQAYIE